jgi:hypothetical protein
MQVSRLDEALLVSGPMSGVQPSGCRSRLEIVRELDRYHGFVAAERWCFPVASEAPEEIPPMARGADRRADSPANGAAKA